MAIRFRRFLVVFALVLMIPGAAFAGMPSLTLADIPRAVRMVNRTGLSDLARQRLEVIGKIDRRVDPAGHERASRETERQQNQDRRGITRKRHESTDETPGQTPTTHTTPTAHSRQRWWPACPSTT